MIILGLEITASRWPWQKGYDWRGMTKSFALLNPEGARFGAGWNYKLGIAIGGSTIMIDLLWGIVKISKALRCTRCGHHYQRSQKGVPLLHKDWPAHIGCVEPDPVVPAHYNGDEVPF